MVPEEGAGLQLGVSTVEIAPLPFVGSPGRPPFGKLELQMDMAPVPGQRSPSQSLLARSYSAPPAELKAAVANLGQMKSPSRLGGGCSPGSGRTSPGSGRLSTLGRSGSLGQGFFNSLELSSDELAEDDENHVEKKRRLSTEQVRLLECNFNLENRLDPERKVQLAKELGLEPRQVSVWFQNRRARWKTKVLEKDHVVLKKRYDEMKKENELLRAEVAKLKAQLNAKGSVEPLTPNQREARPAESTGRSMSEVGDLNSPATAPRAERGPSPLDQHVLLQAFAATPDGIALAHHLASNEALRCQLVLAGENGFQLEERLRQLAEQNARQLAEQSAFQLAEHNVRQLLEESARQVALSGEREKAAGSFLGLVPMAEDNRKDGFSEPPTVDILEFRNLAPTGQEQMAFCQLAVEVPEDVTCNGGSELHQVTPSDRDCSTDSGGGTSIESDMPQAHGVTGLHTPHGLYSREPSFQLPGGSNSHHHSPQAFQWSSEAASPSVGAGQAELAGSQFPVLVKQEHFARQGDEGSNFMMLGDESMSAAPWWDWP